MFKEFDLAVDGSTIFGKSFAYACLPRQDRRSTLADIVEDLYIVRGVGGVGW